MTEAIGLVLLCGLDREIGERCSCGRVLVAEPPSDDVGHGTCPASLPDHTDSFQQRRNVGNQLLLAANDSR